MDELQGVGRPLRHGPSLPAHRRERYRKALHAFNSNQGTAAGVVDAIAEATKVTAADFERASLAARAYIYGPGQTLTRERFETALRNAFVAAGFKVER